VGADAHSCSSPLAGRVPSAAQRHRGGAGAVVSLDVDTAAVGRKGIEELLRVIADPSDKRVPDGGACLAALASQLLSLKKQILDFD
jgi:hypothetical protein